MTVAVSDDTDQGLIHALVLDGAGSARATGWDGVLAWRPGDGPLWVHLEYGAPRATAWLHGEADLGPDIADALCAESTRPRRLSTPQGLLVVLRGVNLNPDASPEDMISLRIWLEGERIITTRIRRLQSVGDVRADVEAGAGPRNACGVLSHVYSRMTERVGGAIEQVTEAADTLEDQVVRSPAELDTDAIAALRRRLIGLRRYLAPQREAMARLNADPDPRIDDLTLRQMRETTDRLVRHVEELDATRELLTVTQDQLAAYRADVLARRSYALTVGAAIFIPLSFLTGLLGINVGGLPLAENRYGFVLVVLLCAVLGIGTLWLFRRSRWL